MEEFIANTNAIKENIKILKKYSKYYAKKKDTFKKNAYGSENCTSISDYLQKISKIYETIAKNTDNIIKYLEQYVNDIENVEQVMSNTGNGSINASNTRAHANKYRNHLKKYNISDEDIFPINTVDTSSLASANSGIAVNVDNPFANVNSSGNANIGNAMPGFNTAVFGFDHIKREGNSIEYKEMCLGDYESWIEKINSGDISAFSLDKLTFNKILDGYIFSIQNQIDLFQPLLDDVNKKIEARDELESRYSEIEDWQNQYEVNLRERAGQYRQGMISEEKIKELGLDKYNFNKTTYTYDLTIDEMVEIIKEKDSETKAAYRELNQTKKELDADTERLTGYTTYAEFASNFEKLEQDQYITSATIKKLESQMAMAPYTLLPFLDDYQNYKNSDDIKTPLEKVGAFSSEKIKNLAEAIEVNEDYAEMGNIYNYLYETEGEKAANEYLNAIEDSVNQILGQKKANEFLESLSGETKTIINENGEEETVRVFSDSALTSISDHLKITGKGLGEGVQSFGEGLAAWIKSSDVYSADEYERMYILDALSKGENSFLYSNNFEISQSIGNMAPTIALSIILSSTGVGEAYAAGAAGAAMGTSAGGNSYHQALVEGYSQGQSIMYGALNGLSEAGLEMVIGGLTGLSDVKITNFLTYLQASAKEGNEEALQEVIDAISRKAIFGEDIEWSDTFKAALKSGAYGAITADILNGASLTVNAGISGINSYLNSNVNSFSQITNMSNMINERYTSLHREQFNAKKDEIVNNIKGIPNQVKEKAKGAYEALNNFKEKLAKDIAQKNENAQILNSDKVQDNDANSQTEKVSSLNIKEAYESIKNMNNYELKNYLSSLDIANLALIVDTMPFDCLNKILQNMDVSQYSQLVNDNALNNKSWDKIININQPTKVIEILNEAIATQDTNLFSKIFETLSNRQVSHIDKVAPGFKELYQNQIENVTTDTNNVMDSYNAMFNKQYDFSPEAISQLATDTLNKLKNNSNNDINLAEHLVKSLEEASLNGSKESYFILETINKYAYSETVFNPQTGDLIQPLEIKLTDDQNQTSSCARNKIYIEPYDSNINEVIFHELGHALHWLSLEWASPQDYDIVIEHTKANLNNKLIKEYCKQANNLYNQIYNECFVELATNKEIQSLNINETDLISKIKDNIKYLSQFNISDVSSIITKIINLGFHDRVSQLADVRFKNKYPSISCISDMIDAMFSGKSPFYLMYKHGKKYYKNATGHANLPFLEMIAQFTSIVLNDKEKLGYVKGLFGEEYYNMLKDTFEKFNPNLKITEDFETKTDLKNFAKKENPYSQDSEVAAKLDNSIADVIDKQLDNIINSAISSQIYGSEITEKLDKYMDNGTSEVQSIANEFSSLNGFEAENKFIENILFNAEKVDNETLLAVVDNLIDTGKINQLTNSTIAILANKSNEIFHKIAVTDKFYDLIYKNLTKPVTIPLIRKLNEDEFSNIFNNPEIQKIINEKFQNEIFNYDTSEFINFVQNNGYSLEKLFKSQIEKGNLSNYKKFLEILSKNHNLEILKNNDYYYAYKVKRLLEIETTDKSINDIKSNLNKISQEYDDLCNAKLQSLQEHCDFGVKINKNGELITTNQYDESYCYDIVLEVNGKEQILTEYPDFNGSINISKILKKDQRLLSKLFDDQIKIRSINKNKFTVTGIEVGLNQIEVKVNDQIQKIIINNTSGLTSTNIQNILGNNVQNFEIIKVTPLGTYDKQVDNSKMVYKVKLTLENDEVKTFYTYANGNNNLDIDSYIEANNITSIKNVETSIVETNNYDVDFSIYNTPQSIEIFSNKKYGGNQSDVYNLINDYLTNNNSSDIEQSQILNNLIDKYFPNISNSEKIKLAENYATNGCGYIAVANAFLSYMNNQTNGQNIFEQKFGYKMKNDQSGSYNTAALAFEMYLNWAKSNFENMNQIFEEFDEQGLSTSKIIESVKPFFAKYNIELTLSTSADIRSFESVIYKNDIFSSLAQILNNPNSFNILAANHFNMEFLNVGEELLTNSDGALNNTISNGNNEENVGKHAMLITDIDSEGNLIVSSWGGKYKVNLNSIEQNELKYNAKDGYILIRSIDFNMAPEENIENINNAPTTEELNSKETNVEEELSNANDEKEKIIDTETTEKFDNNIDSEITEAVKTATTEKLNNYLTNLKYSDHGFLHSIADSIYSKLRRCIYTNTNKFIGLNEKILDEGLYYFTSEENIDEILRKGYIEANGPINSYGKSKNLFFNGIPEVGAYVTNLNNLPLTAIALKINPGLDIIESNKLKVRNLDDSAIIYDGKLKLNKVFVNKEYFVLTLIDNELKYIKVSKEYYENYINSNDGKQIADFINNKKIKSIISRDWIHRVVNKLAGGALLERNWQYKSENNTYADVNLNFMKYEILSTIEDNWTLVEKARKLYNELNKRFHYNIEYIKADKNNELGKMATIYNQNINFNNIKSNYVICKGWSQLYYELLIASGFNPKNITIEGNDNIESHKWVEIKVDEQHIIIADATDAINHANDLVNCKSGMPTSGFIYAINTLSHRRIRTLQNQIDLEKYSKNWLDIDKKLGIVNSDAYFSDNLNKANKLFATEENLNPIDEVNNIINIPIPDIMDGFEAYVYLGNIIYNQLDNKQVKVSKEYRNFKINNTNEPICLLSFELEDSTIYMTYSQSTGKQVFNDYDSYKAFIDTLEK